MYLKSLTLKGFKSFADKSTLKLEPGITAIVGPNGSGKSNISDAVLWVLGERNAKNLRGQAMEDVIFAGSSARRATGVAEVELVLDNKDKTLPIDFDEVVITRRMYRSGESEYLINNTAARRMDVLDILHDTGLGSGTHSIISQGSLDSVLQSKPEDRRALIEEAAGVLKHKQRMEKSSRKLERMQNHVARVSDVVNEVARQLGPLERKAKKAQTYQELKSKRDEANLALAVDDLRTLQRTHGEISKREHDLSADVEEKRKEIADLESQIESLQEKIRNDNADATEISNKFHSISSLVEKLDSVQVIVSDRRHTLISRAEEIELAIAANELEKTNQLEELERAKAAYAESHSEKTMTEEKANAMHSDMKDLQEKLSSMKSVLNESSVKAEGIENEIRALRSKQVSSQEALTNGLAHIKVIDGHISELELQLARCESDAKEAKSQCDIAKEALDGLKEQESAARNLVGSCTQARQSAQAALDDANAQEKSLSAQISALEDVERQMSCEKNDVYVWLKKNKEELFDSAKHLKELISVEPEYESLVELFLGNGIDALLLESAHSIGNIAETLKEHMVNGEIDFLIPQQNEFMELKEKEIQDAIQKGTLTGDSRLVSHIGSKGAHSNILLSLLGNIFICDSLDSAIEMHSKDKLGICFTTKDASIVYPSGKIAIGTALLDEEQSRLSRLRHINELKSTLKEAREHSMNAAQRSNEANEALRAAQSESLDLSEKIAALKGNLQSAEKQAQAMLDKLSSVRREYEEVQEQKRRSQAIVNEAKPFVDSSSKEIEEKTASLKELEQTIRGTAAQIDPLQIEYDEMNAAFQELKLELTRLREQEVYAKRVIDRNLDDIERYANSHAQLNGQLSIKRQASKRLIPILEALDSISSNAQTRSRSIESRANEAQSASSELNAQIADLRKTVHGRHGEFDEKNESLSAIRIEKAKCEMQVESAVNAIVRDCNTPLDVALAIPPLEDRSAIEDSAFKLNRRIANLGTINPEAAQDYQELKERYDYLSDQLGDLDRAAKSLRRINRIIEGRIKDDFANTFNRVNENFQEIFSILFPGGNAYLSLEDPDDLENTGVEVTAQPAGKRISKMSLMSGGEKSLTALALLFALYKTRSTPFYILDEVEAALDDTNLRRLVGFIDAMRSTTQLLMITHQRRTMETADILFGVSMQADGVTKVISQKLENALSNAE